MRVLGLDIGLKRTGVAISDPLQKTARPLTVLSPDEFRGDVLRKIVRDNEVTEIVVGMPSTLKGEAGEAADMANEATEYLRREFDVPVVTYDERLTTAMAKSALQRGGVSSKKRKEKVDMVAAALILQGYLDLKASKAG